MRKLYSFGLAISCLVASGMGASMTACSSSNTGTSSVPDGGGGAGGHDGGGSSTGGGGGTTTDAGGGACQSCSCLPPADIVCDQNQNGSCPDCCTTTHQSGALIFLNSVIQNCCAACRTACAATLCSPNASAPDLLCQNCIDGQLAPGSGTNCNATVNAACNDNKDCVAYANCSACCP